MGFQNGVGGPLRHRHAAVFVVAVGACIWQLVCEVTLVGGCPTWFHNLSSNLGSTWMSPWHFAAV